MSESDDILERAARALEGIMEGWHVSSHEVVRKTIIWAADGYAVCDARVHHGRHGPEAAEANARFIAAAPGLVRDLMAEIDRLRMGGKDGD